MKTFKERQWNTFFKDNMEGNSFIVTQQVLGNGNSCFKSFYCTFHELIRWKDKVYRIKAISKPYVHVTMEIYK